MIKISSKLFAERLKEIRKKRGYTLRRAAELLEISHSTLACYESGRNQPDIETLGKLADFYETPVDWLIGLIDTEE